MTTSPSPLRSDDLSDASFEAYLREEADFLVDDPDGVDPDGVDAAAQAGSGVSGPGDRIPDWDKVGAGALGVLLGALATPFLFACLMTGWTVVDHVGSGDGLASAVGAGVMNTLLFVAPTTMFTLLPVGGILWATKHTRVTVLCAMATVPVVMVPFLFVGVRVLATLWGS